MTKGKKTIVNTAVTPKQKKLSKTYGEKQTSKNRSRLHTGPGRYGPARTKR